MSEAPTMYDAVRMAARELVLGGDLPGSLLEDVEQEGLLWCLENPGDVENSKMEDGTYHIGQLAAKIRRALVPLVERERDAMYGSTRPYVSRYDVKIVEKVLPYVLDPGSTAPADDVDQAGFTPKGMDPGRYQQWMVYRLDVASALADLDDDHRAWLVARHVEGLTWDQMVAQFGHPRTTCYRRTQEALVRLVDSLNGDLPDQESGHRRVMSNAEARATTERQYGG